MRVLRWTVALVGVWAVGLMLWTPAQQPPASRMEAVLVGSQAVIVAPRQMVAPPQVEYAEWSPSGRYLVVVAVQSRWRSWQSPPEELGWVAYVWDNTRQQTKQVAKGNPGDELDSFHWLPRSETAVALLRQRVGGADEERFRWVLVVLNAAQGSLKTVAVVPEGTAVRYNPNAPMALLVDGETVRVVRTDGTVSAPLPLPEEAVRALNMGHLRWSRDGWQAFWQSTPGGEWHVLDLRTGAIAPASAPPERSEPVDEQPKSALSVRVMAQSVGAGDYRASTKALWLEGEKSRALVCADVESAQLSPRGDAVFYVSQGAGFVAPLMRVPREAYEQARREAIRQTIMSNAKQIGLALMMYVQDYDETFPPASGVDVQAVLMPYLKNEGIFNFPGTTFVYLLDAQRLQSVDRPAETMVAYIQAPGGRAVIWADGHVTWQDEQGRE